MSNYNMEEESWKDINGFEGHYQVSDLGRIRSIKRKYHIMSLRLHNDYPVVNLYLNGKHVTKSVHGLVANHFVINDNTELKKQVNHIDGNKANNNASNLEWCTSKYNINHAIEKGLLTYSEERAQKISKAKKGMVFSEEWKNNLSINNARYWLGKTGPNKGKVMDDEQKKKIGAHFKGGKNPGARSIKTIDANGKEIEFDNIKSASDYYDLNYTTVTTGLYRNRNTYTNKKTGVTFIV